MIFPVLRDRKGDISKKWYVELSQRNPKTDEMVRRRFETLNGININELKNVKERYDVANKLIIDLNAKLKNGWTIFNDTETAIYEDQTQYAAEAAIYKKMVKSNKNYIYWCSKYLEEVLYTSGLKEDTLITYKGRYRVFKNWLIKNDYINLDVTGLTNEIICEFFYFLRDEKSNTTHTSASYANLLNNLFDFIIKNKGLILNPIHSLPVNKIVKDLGAEALYKEDLYKIMKAMDEVDPQLALACRFEYYCGLRPGKEVRLMKIGDLNLRKGVSRVKISSDHNKANRKKEVIIPDVFLDYLLDVWKLDTYDSDLFVFGREKVPGKQHLGKNTLRDRFNRIRDALNLPNIYKFYSMKHTGAITLAEQGESLINIRDHLGHTKVDTTEKYLERYGFNESEIIRKNFPRI